MQFLNPGLVAGALLFAVPLIIHLLNRQRHKRRDWAAMEFLLRAYQKTRNRLRNENLLLLLLRCLIPVALALALARPMLQSAAALLGQSGSVHHVVVLDQSYSMGFQQDGMPSPFERGRAMALRLIERLQDHPERNDKVTLVTAGVRPRFVVRDELNLGLAKAQWLDVQRPEDAAGDLLPALLQVAAAIEEAADPQVQVYVLSDLQRRSLGRALQDPGATAAAGPEFRDTLRDAVERLQKRDGTQVHWIDTGPLADQRQGGTVDNVQLTDVRLEQPIAIARVPVTVVAQLQNHGTRSASVQVTLEIDGGEPSRKVVVLDPGAEGEAEFTVTLRETGRRRLRLSLQRDGLEADDEWSRTLEVRDRVRVLVVDGAADDDPLKTYEYFYRGMLDPMSLGGAGADAPLGELAMFEVTAADTLALLSGQQSPEAFDVTILADVDRLNERAADAIERALRSGKGLLVALGRRADPASYDLQLGLAGDGPMPFRLGRAAGGSAGSGVTRAPTIELPNHPTLREFEEEVYREILQAIPVHQWFTLAPDTLAEGAEVVLRLTDPDRSPLLVTGSYGEGRVAVLTSAPGSEYDGDRWNRLDDQFIVFPLLHGLVQWLALPAQDPFNVEVGTSLVCSVPARPTDLEVLLPERAGGRKQPLSQDARALPGGRYALPPFAGTTMGGFYVYEAQLDRDTGREPWSQPFAVHVDPAEGVLGYVAHADAQQALGLERIELSIPTDSDDAGDPSASELGPSLLWLTLLLVAGEAALARWVSGRRT
ncbi:MAG: BatA domain-containing protein [Planctomycetota bacterium]